MDEKEISETNPGKNRPAPDFTEDTEPEEILTDKDDKPGVAQEKPYDVSKIKVDSNPMMLFQAMRKLNLGEIELHPEFQRNEVWNEIRESRLIESLMIGIPMPAFYIDARNPDEWSMVDGQQRMTTFKKFYIEKTLKLRGLEFLKELSGMTFDKLPRHYQRRIEETQLQLFLIQPDTPEEAIFTIFYRINTGGAPLTGQEIRHALNKGAARELLQELAETDEFLEATTRSISPKRMDDRECVLRFFAFHITHYSHYRKSDLNAFLSETMKQINGMSESEIADLECCFKDAMVKAKLVFGNYAFRKIFPNVNKRSMINKALFEVESVILQKHPADALRDNSPEIIKRFSILVDENREFNNSISISTGDIAAVNKRFGEFERLLEECLK